MKYLGGIILSFLLCTGMNFQGFSQGEQVNENSLVGKSFTPFAVDIENSKLKNFSLSSFKGKWLILDFWSVGCASCIESFPKVESLQNEFKDKVQFVLVGRDWGNVREVFEKYRNKFNLHLPIVYDTMLFGLLRIQAVPFVVWMDENRIVRAVTSNTNVNRDNIESFISGNEPKLFEQTRSNKRVDMTNTALVSTAKDSQIVFRSILTKYLDTIGISGVMQTFINSDNGPKVQFFNYPLIKLFEQAYADTISSWPNNTPNRYGTYWPKLVLETADSIFLFGNTATHTNLFCYSLTISSKMLSSMRLQEIMRRDLSDNFNFDVSIETRVMPCWKLVVLPGWASRLRTSGDTPDYLQSRNPLKIYLRNQPVLALISEIWYYHQFEPPILDETRISGNIDIQFDAILTDIEDIRNGLHRSGLDLVKTERPMKVIVIRDRGIKNSVEPQTYK